MGIRRFEQRTWVGTGARTILNTSELLLVATVFFAALGTLGSLTGLLFQRTGWGIAISHSGLIGGSVSAAILAAVLYGREPDQSAVALPTWNWLSIPEPRRLSLELGFEATWVKAAIVSLAGSGILAATWTGLVRKKARFFNAVHFTNSLVFAAAVGFVFAPNLTQSLLGWGCISLLVSVLIRVTNGPIDPVAARKTASNSSNDYLSSATRVLHGVGVAVVERLGRGLTIRFPAWVGEQFEVIETSPVSTLLLAIVLGACSVLLTWLIVT